MEHDYQPGHEEQAIALVLQPEELLAAELDGSGASW